MIIIMIIIIIAMSHRRPPRGAAADPLRQGGRLGLLLMFSNMFVQSVISTSSTLSFKEAS